METLVEIRDLHKLYSQRSGLFGERRTLHAVNGVSLRVDRGKTLGVVGESGCGKSTLGRMVVGLLEPTAGEVFIAGRALYDQGAHADYRAFRRSLSGVIQMVFQDPYSSLNPRMRIGESVAEPLRCSTAWLARGGGVASEPVIRRTVLEILGRVGLEPEAAERYPHQFSGGQRQRVAIARALVTRPTFVVCDEPTSSLDASVQSQVLNLLRDLQDELALTYCFISHDLAVVRHMSDRVAVMYRGFLVEEGETGAVLDHPCHPYTRLLVDSVPGGPPTRRSGQTDAGQSGTAPLRSDRPGDGNQFGPQIEGSKIENRVSEGRTTVDRTGEKVRPARPAQEGQDGCPFFSRCDRAMDGCAGELPLLASPSGFGNRLVRCRLFEHM